MTTRFRVCSMPSDSDTKTNQIYLNPSDYEYAVGSSGIVLINGYPFTVKPNNQVQAGLVAMNSIHRRMLNISTAVGNTVVFDHFDPRLPDASEMTLRVEHIMAAKKGGTIDCVEFALYVKTQFGGQCFKVNQQFAVVLESSNMRLSATVEKIKVKDNVMLSITNNNSDNNNSNMVQYPSPTSNAEVNFSNSGLAYLAASTSIVIVPTEKSGISLVNVPDNQLDAQQTQLLQNFDLESLGIGGLRTEFAQIFRRAFASRMVPASCLKQFGVKHVKGVLLYGPPGTGKTLIARKIGEILNCHEPKIVNGPEVLNKYVGQTEENVRKLFIDAEEEQAAKGEQSKLHLIIFDEFDAICKRRGEVKDNTGVTDNLVNQLLSKIDGVNALNNILLIGMTNRKDLIDEAVLRPGRFELHVEIGLPDEAGRVEIFRIHTKAMREGHKMASDVDLNELAARTKNFSGAEIEGVVKIASSNAFNRAIDFEHLDRVPDTKNAFVTKADFESALNEITPAFGQSKDKFDELRGNGIINYGDQWQVLQARCEKYVAQLTDRHTRIHTLAVLLEGVAGAGKSAIAAYLIETAQFPYVKVISGVNMVGVDEMSKVRMIKNTFEDAYRSPESCIVLDDLERLIEFSQLGGRYSNSILQALLVLIKRPPPEGKKLLIIGTTAQYNFIDSLELASCFSVKLQIPLIPIEAVYNIATMMKISFASQAEVEQCLELFPRPLPMKQLMLVLEMAAERDGESHRPVITTISLSQALQAAGIVQEPSSKRSLIHEQAEQEQHLSQY